MPSTATTPVFLPVDAVDAPVKHQGRLQEGVVGEAEVDDPLGVEPVHPLLVGERHAELLVRVSGAEPHVDLLHASEMLESALLFTSIQSPAKMLEPFPKSHFRSNCGWNRPSSEVPVLPDVEAVRHEVRIDVQDQVAGQVIDRLGGLRGGGHVRLLGQCRCRCQEQRRGDAAPGSKQNSRDRVHSFLSSPAVGRSRPHRASRVPARGPTSSDSLSKNRPKSERDGRLARLRS